MPHRVALIDGSGLVYRAWFAIPSNLRTTFGLHTNAVYGFAQMFRKLLAGRTPRYGAVVFDAPGRQTFRDAAYPAYKAGRPRMPEELREQLPWIERLVAAHDYPILRVPGVEADDVIGTLTAQALERGHEVTIVSGDKDFAQLVSERVRLFDSTKEVVYDPELVRRKWGVPPERFRDWLALVGDKIDNVPGVPGIGAKTATHLLEQYGDLQTILAHAPEIRGRAGKALRAHEDQARLSQELVTIRQDVPLELTLDDLEVPPPSPEKLNAIYRELEFFSLLSAEQVADATRHEQAQFFVVDDLDMAREALSRECSLSEPVSVYLLVEYPSHLVGELVGIALSPRPTFGLYFPLRGPGKVLGQEGLDVLRPWLEDPAHPKVCHESKRDLVALERAGIQLAGVVGDTALASYLVDPTQHLPHRLEQVSRAYLGRALQPVRTLVGGGRSMKRFAELSVDRAGAWACHNAEAIGALWPELARRARDAGVWRHLHDIDLPLAPVLARVERNGIRVDPEVLVRLEARYEAEKQDLEAQMHALAGHPFNPGSLPQLGTVLFEELGLPVLKRTKTGYSTASDVLERLASRHPMVPLVLRWRTLAKLIHTYTRVLREAVGPDGRIHPTLQQTVSASGRIISTDPDLQRTPVRTEEYREVREAFIASEGHRIVSADWSQIELRLLAHFTEDPLLLEAYQHDRDIHAATASQLFGVPLSQVTPAQRNVGKTVNFATIYGQGATALAQQLQIERSEAQRYIQTFFETYAGVQRWRDQVVTDAYVHGYVGTLLGRRRYIPELSSNNFTDRSYGERIAVNTVIQGSAADLCKLAMIRVDAALRERGLAARMVLQIHDELLFDVPESEVEQVSELARREMAQVVALEVPLVVDVGVGASWAEAH